MSANDIAWVEKMFPPSESMRRLQEIERKDAPFLQDARHCFASKYDPREFSQMRQDMKRWTPEEGAYFLHVYDKLISEPGYKRETAAREHAETLKSLPLGEYSIPRAAYSAAIQASGGLASLGARVLEDPVFSIGEKAKDLAKSLRKGKNLSNALASVKEKSRMPENALTAADIVSQDVQDIEAGSRLADKDSFWPGFATAARGAARSVTTAATLAPLGPAGIIGGFSVLQGNESLTVAKEQGLKGAAKWGFVARSTAFEAIPAAAFSLVGMGGFEKVIGSGLQLTKPGVVEVLKRMGIAISHEMAEEFPTELLHAYNSIWTGLSQEEMTLSNAWKIFKAVLPEVALSIGATGGYHGIRAQKSLKQFEEAKASPDVIAQLFEINKNVAQTAIDTAKKAQAKGRNYDVALGTEVQKAVLKTEGGLQGWIKGHEKQAKAIAAKEQPSRTDMKGSDLPQMNELERAELSVALQQEKSKTDAEIESRVISPKMNRIELKKRYPSIPDDIISRIGNIEIADRFAGEGEWQADTGLNIKANEKSLLHEVGHVIDNILTEQQSDAWEALSKKKLKKGILGNKPEKLANDPYSIWENLYTAFSIYHRAVSGETLSVAEKSSIKNNTGVYSFIHNNLSEGETILPEILADYPDLVARLTKEQEHLGGEEVLGISEPPLHIDKGGTPSSLPAQKPEAGVAAQARPSITDKLAKEKEQVGGIVMTPDVIEAQRSEALALATRLLNEGKTDDLEVFALNLGVTFRAKDPKALHEIIKKKLKSKETLPGDIRKAIDSVVVAAKQTGKVITQMFADHDDILDRDDKQELEDHKRRIESRISEIEVQQEKTLPRTKANKKFFDDAETSFAASDEGIAYDIRMAVRLEEQGVKLTQKQENEFRDAAYSVLEDREQTDRDKDLPYLMELARNMGTQKEASASRKESINSLAKDLALGDLGSELEQLYGMSEDVDSALKLGPQESLFTDEEQVKLDETKRKLEKLVSKALDVAERKGAKLGAIQQKAVDKKKQADIEKERTSLVAYVKKELPPHVQGKLLSAVKNAKTPGTFRKAVERIAKIKVETAEKTEAQKEKIATHKAEIKEKKEKRVLRRKMIKTIKKARARLSKMGKNEKAAIEELVDGIEWTRLSGKKRKSLENTLTWAREQQKKGVAAELPQSVLESLVRLSSPDYTTLTDEDLTAIHDAVVFYSEIDVQKKRLRKRVQEMQVVKKLARTESELDTSEQSSRDILERIADRVFPEQEFTKWLNELVADQKDVDTLMIAIADGKEDGASREIFTENMWDADGKNIAYRIMMAQKLSEYLQKHKTIEKLLDQKKKEIVKIGKADISRQQMLSLYLYSLNPGGLRHIQQGGFKLRTKKGRRGSPVIVTDSMLKQLNDMVTQEEKDFLGWVDKEIYKLQFKAINEVFSSIHGYDLTEEQYYQAVHVVGGKQRDLDEYGADLLKHVETMYGGDFASVDRGMTMERVDSKKPIWLNDISVNLNTSVKRAAAYIAFEKPLYLAGRVLNDEGCKRALMQSDRGEAIHKALKKYLQDIAGNAEDIAPQLGVLNWLLQKKAAATIHGSPSLWIKQRLSYFAAMAEVKSRYLIQGIAAYEAGGLDGEGLLAHRDKVETYWEKMLPILYDRFRGGHIKEITKTATIYKQGRSMHPVQVMDRATVCGILEGARLQAKAEGMNDAEMVKFAEKALRRTQPSRLMTDRPGVLRRPSIRWMTMFMTATSKQFSTYARIAHRARGEIARTDSMPKKLVIASKASAEIMLINTLTGLGVVGVNESWKFIMYFLAGWDRREDDTFAERVAAASLGTAGAGIVFVRDMLYAWEMINKDYYKGGRVMSTQAAQSVETIMQSVGGASGLIRGKTARLKWKAGVDLATEVIESFTGVPARVPGQIIKGQLLKEASLLEYGQVANERSMQAELRPLYAKIRKYQDEGLSISKFSINQVEKEIDSIVKKYEQYGDTEHLLRATGSAAYRLGGKDDPKDLDYLKGLLKGLTDAQIGKALAIEIKRLRDNLMKSKKSTGRKIRKPRKPSRSKRLSSFDIRMNKLKKRLK